MKKFSTILKIFIAILVITSCKKSPTPAPTPTPVDPCLNKTIVVAGTTTTTSNATATNGSIAASASGGNGFTFSLNSGTAQASGTFSNLAIGNYTVTAKDSDGCVGTKSFTISATPCPSITVSGTSTNATNPSTSNGTISATATGSTGINFSINGTTFQPTGNFTSLAAANYTVTAKDANGCTGTLIFVVGTISCPIITATATPTNTVKCASNTGTLTLSGNGGIAPYTYSINGGAFQTNGLFSTLGVGNVTYVVKDVNGCSSISGSAAIANAPAGPLFTAVKNILNTYCTGCHGSASGQNGINYNDDCVIISQKARIKARAVDANPSQMPPSGAGLTTAERTAVTNWVNAGGNYNN